MTDRIKPPSRQALLDAAAAVLTENPGASLGEVAARAGVGRATLHRHFQSREVLIRELTLEAIRLTDEATAHIEGTGTAREALREVVAAVVPLGDRLHFLLSEPYPLDDPDIRAGIARQSAELAALLEAAKDEGAIAREMPTAWAVAAFDALIYAAWSAVRDGAVARRDAPDLVFRTLTRGLAPGRAAPR